MKPVNWKALRSDFPILNQQVHGHPLIYFDNAATTQVVPYDVLYDDRFRGVYKNTA